MGKLIKTSVFAAIGCAVLLVAGCLPNGLSVNAARPQPVFDGNAWVTYWDFEQGLKEAVKVQSQLNSVSYFAAVFDGNGKPMIMGHAHNFIGKKLVRYRAKINKYLTVVNDVYLDIHNPKGESIAKDTQVLLKLFQNEETIRAHIADLFAIVKKNRFDGLEIDYENLWKDPVVARNFMHFLEILVPMAEEEKIPLRIVLEPGFSEFETPIDLAENKFEFPEGPEYVVMCYNLFGTHSKLAGPKADIKFLDRMLVKTSQLPRPHSVALAVGGCVWQEGKTPYYVTENEAVQLAKTLKAEIKRDDSSQALHYNGRNSSGKNVECWFADARTIIAWKRQALDYGVDGISLWRLGGNHKIEKYYPGIMKKN